MHKCQRFLPARWLALKWLSWGGCDVIAISRRLIASPKFVNEWWHFVPPSAQKPVITSFATVEHLRAFVGFVRALSANVKRWDCCLFWMRFLWNSLKVTRWRFKVKRATQKPLKYLEKTISCQVELLLLNLLCLTFWYYTKKSRTR